MFRVAAVYAGIAFILIQVADITFPALNLPDWTITFILVVLLIGFPITVGLAWAFDITEKGVVRTPAEDKAAPASTRRPIFGNLTLAIVAALAIAVAVWSWFGSGSDASTIRSIAVLPLENLMNDPEQDYFVDGMHEALITELSRISALKVISRTSAMRYKDTDQLVPAIARELGVDAVVEGSVLKAGNQVRITAQLIHGTTDKHLWVNDYEEDLIDILALQKNVAQAIAKEIKVALTAEEEAQLASVHAINPEAYEAYLKGRYFWNKRTEEGLIRGLKYFEEAIEKDPGYALAYAGVAESYLVLVDWGFLPPREAYPKAMAAAMRALEIESTLAEARISLAYIKYIYDWNWGEAEEEFKRALELNSNYATGHQWYGEFLTAMGRFDEALEEIRRARELDPLSLIISAIEGWFYFFARQYDLAIEQCRRTLEMDPNFAPAHLYLLWCYTQKGMNEEANAEFQILQELIGRVASLKYVSAVWVERGEALAAIDELKKLSQQTYVAPTFIAIIYVDLDDRDQAFKWLEKAYEVRSGTISLKVAPVWDPLRDDPRFTDLLRRMNFPE
ncbi:MAG: hypothetical protein JSU61_12215 [Fidelibacterota bacterium]|nr:MAG: hypothetical protein JSU61_12215 [Candidatus Neomarinimicrobiota bacterium]